MKSDFDDDESVAERCPRRRDRFRINLTKAAGL